jgi:hypothetical protein
MKRSRGRNRRSGGNPQNAFNNPNRHYESVGPDVKIRGSAQQVLEKYLQYARDAQTSGDRILSEAYFQFAEHYQRIVAKQQEARVQHQGQNQNRHGGDRRDDRDNRPNGDRDYRGNQPSEGADMGEEDAGEAVVVSTAPRHEEEDDGADSLRVIDSSDEDEGSAVSEEDDEATAEEAAPDTRERGDRGSRNRRKPYRAREERAPRQKEPKEDTSAGSETEGVMKTLSRGRRRASSEEATSAETTD